MKKVPASYWINKLALKPHPEGGYYKETYKSSGTIDTQALPKLYTGSRHYSTMIYFLLTKSNFSAFHRIASDESWHFYTGDPLNIHSISPKGVHSKITLGNDIENGQTFQAVIPALHWFGAEVVFSGEYALVGCTVAPGFHFDDFELADRHNFIKLFPLHEELITSLTH